LRTRPTLILFLKEPRPGRVKTRLGAGIGMTAAAWWFRHQAARVIRRLGRDPRWRLVLAVSPDREGLASRVWPSGLPRWPQGAGDLGARMARALRGMPPGPVLIVGADIPDLGAAHVAACFRLLDRHAAVLGPAPDGGYWAVGLRRGGRAAPARLFRGVRWSTEHALADTLASLRPLDVGLGPVLTDVDGVGDLERGVADPRGEPLPHLQRPHLK
jgi:rSAM/selenodomain-associated transferase 1